MVLQHLFLVNLFFSLSVECIQTHGEVFLDIGGATGSPSLAGQSRRMSDASILSTMSGMADTVPLATINACKFSSCSIIVWFWSVNNQLELPILLLGFTFLWTCSIFLSKQHVHFLFLWDFLQNKILITWYKLDNYNDVIWKPTWNVLLILCSFFILLQYLPKTLESYVLTYLFFLIKTPYYKCNIFHIFFGKFGKIIYKYQIKVNHNSWL